MSRRAKPGYTDDMRTDKRLAGIAGKRLTYQRTKKSQNTQAANAWFHPLAQGEGVPNYPVPTLALEGMVLDEGGKKPMSRRQDRAISLVFAGIFYLACDWLGAPFPWPFVAAIAGFALYRWTTS